MQDPTIQPIQFNEPPSSDADAIDITPNVPIFMARDTVSLIDNPTSLAQYQSGLRSEGSTTQAGSGNSIFKIDPQKGIWLGAANFSSAPFSVSMAGAVVATSLTTTHLDIPDTITANSFHVDTVGNAWWGATTLAASIASITKAGLGTFSNIVITGGSITATPISAIPNSTATDISLLSFTQNLAFTSASATQVNWGTGTISMSNGRTFTISAGNTGVMAALTYVYLDTGVSSTVLQTTTTYSTAMGANKALIAVAQNNTTAASVITYGGGQPVIDGGAQIAALSIVAGSIAAGTITGAKIAATTITAANITAGTITTTEIAATTITGSNINTLNISGKTATFDTGTIGGFTMSATQLTATNFSVTSGAANVANLSVGTGANLGGLNSGNAASDIAFWAGDTFANRATAPFRVDMAGNLTATSATITLPEIAFYTVFEASGRFTLSGNVPTFDTIGCKLATTGAANNQSINQWQTANQANVALFSGSPTVAISINTFNAVANIGIIYVGLGFPSSAGVYTGTVNHIGFKIVKDGSTITIYGTQADGTTENATASLGTSNTTDSFDLILKVNGTTSVDYYVRKNGGALSTKVTATGNVPTSTTSTFSFFADNQANANVVSCYVAAASYKR